MTVSAHRRSRGRLATAVGLSLAALTLMAPSCEPDDGTDFVHWEIAPVHGLAMSPDGTRLVAVNTPDHRVEVFDLGGALPVHAASIPVGLAPVSVRAQSADVLWVANHVSDSVSVVDVASRSIVGTISTGDEPADLVLAGDPLKLFVSVSQENAIEVRAVGDLGAPPQVIPIAGEDPRALATDGARVFAAIFESGNRTTILAPEVVSEVDGPHGGLNPPPNDGSSFEPPLSGGLPPPPPVGLIVRKDGGDAWRDDTGADWSAKVGWDLHDHDLAILPVADPASVSYVSGLMNVDMALATLPDGRVSVVGTEATNGVRFEPNLTGTFVRTVMGIVDPGTRGVAPAVSVVDLNPHLDYSTGNVTQQQRDLSLADPRGIAWRSDGVAFVSGMGSDNVVVTDATGARIGQIEVGSGPSSLVLDEARQRLYVLNRFDATVSVIDTTNLVEVGRVPFFDPTPDVIRDGRPMLYDAHRTSGLGTTACASCHVDARMDQLSWDLGAPDGSMKAFEESCLTPDGCTAFHPMKGPMTTQTLVGIVGVEPLHWRGDRHDLAEFSGAFVGLLGDDAEPSPAEMAAFESFLATIRFPPNPFRKLDGSVRATPLANGGVPAEGERIYFQDLTDPPRRCNDCHTFPTGTNRAVVPASFDTPTPGIKVAQLRNLYEKTGFSHESMSNNRGFGFLHDGSIPTVALGFTRSGFSFPDEQSRLDVEAFVFSFATDTHPAVGKQITLTTANVDLPDVAAYVSSLMSLAESGAVGLVARGRLDGEPRGAYYTAARRFQTDSATQSLSRSELEDAVRAGSPWTLTVVPFEARVRIGADRDADGRFDHDD